MSWRMDSSAGAAIWDTQPLTREQELGRDEEIQYLVRKEKKQGKWQMINGRLAERGDLVASRGNYESAAAYALGQAGSAVAMISTTNIQWWNPTSYTPIPANSVQAPMTCQMYACGVVTTSTTSLTTTMNPAIGTAVAGTALGASGAVSFPAATAITGAYWELFYRLTIRTGGESGTAVGAGQLNWTPTAGTGAPTGATLFGAGQTVASSINWVTTAQGLLIAAAPSASTITVTPAQIHFTLRD